MNRSTFTLAATIVTLWSASTTNPTTVMAFSLMTIAPKLKLKHFSSFTTQKKSIPKKTTSLFLLDNNDDADSSYFHDHNKDQYMIKNSKMPKKTKVQKYLSKAFVTTVLILSPLALPSFVCSPSPAFASDYAADTVTSIVQKIDKTAGNKEETFATFEEVAAIITEGKGVGGDVNYSNQLQLGSGQVADEDTTIYNPGLSLLTESEKKEIVNAIVRSKKTALSSKAGNAAWPTDNQLGFEFLKTKLDPLHTYELSGYLNIFPYVAAVSYLGVLVVQQNLRGIFPFAYILGVLVVVAPIGFLIAIGP